MVLNKLKWALSSNDPNWAYKGLNKTKWPWMSSKWALNNPNWAQRA